MMSISISDRVDGGHDVWVDGQFAGTVERDREGLFVGLITGVPAAGDLIRGKSRDGVAYQVADAWTQGQKSKDDEQLATIEDLLRKASRAGRSMMIHRLSPFTHVGSFVGVLTDLGFNLEGMNPGTRLKSLTELWRAKVGPGEWSYGVTCRDALVAALGLWITEAEGEISDE